jgi:tetratricopeptide (TPR) repeat protein
VSAVQLLPELEPHSVEARLVVDAEHALERHDFDEAAAFLSGVNPSTVTQPRLALRALLTGSWAKLQLGEPAAAAVLLERARAITEGGEFDDLDRAEVLFQLGCCRLNLSEVANATSLLTLALELCERSGRPCDRLRARALDWRSRCYQRRRDWAAAHADIERGLELADALGDEHVTAGLYFQASIVAEREGQWLMARCYGEEALELHKRSGDGLGVHKLLNNLGGIEFLLGNHERAAERLKESFRLALELGSDVGAAYAMSSLAQVQLRAGALDEAERHATRALELLDGRIDHLAEIGNARLVLARSLFERDRYADAVHALDAADVAFEQLGSASHRATGWVARAELETRRGDETTALALYRRAVDALQDIHF